MPLTPIQDSGIEDLLLYVKEWLNTAAIAWATETNTAPLTVVADTKPIQCTLEAVQQLPLLACYRTQLSTPTGADLLSSVTARMDYFVMVNMQNRETQNAFFTWVAKQIALCLEEYNSVTECLEIDMRSLDASIRYTLARGAAGPMTIPFLRLQFSFEDFEMLAR